MRSKQLAMCWAAVALAFLFLGFRSAPRNTAYLSLGIVFAVIAAATLWRARRARDSSQATGSRAS